MQSVHDMVTAIGKLLANKGIPPFLLASNIAEEAYESVRLWKENGEIRVETVCTDDETAQRHVYLYRYDSNLVLQSIEQTVADNHAMIWSREREVAQMVRDAMAAARESSEPLPLGHSEPDIASLPGLVHA